MTANRTRPAVRARRIGFLVPVLASLVVLFLINAWPTWRAVPFLTDGMAQVRWLFNLWLGAGAVANLGCLAYDPAWLRPLGGLATTAVGIAVLVSLWLLFPFDFHNSAFPWAVTLRTALGVATFGCVVGVLVNLGQIAANVAPEEAPRPGRGPSLPRPQ